MKAAARATGAHVSADWTNKRSIISDPESPPMSWRLPADSNFIDLLGQLHACVFGPRGPVLTRLQTGALARARHRAFVSFGHFGFWAPPVAD